MNRKGFSLKQTTWKGHSISHSLLLVPARRGGLFFVVVSLEVKFRRGTKRRQTRISPSGCSGWLRSEAQRSVSQWGFPLKQSQKEHKGTMGMCRGRYSDHSKSRDPFCFPLSRLKAVTQKREANSQPSSVAVTFATHPLGNTPPPFSRQKPTLGTP